MTRALTRTAWNSNGVTWRWVELACFVSKYDVDIVLLSETHLLPNTCFSLTAYVTYCSDRIVPDNRADILNHRRSYVDIYSHRKLSTEKRSST